MLLKERFADIRFRLINFGGKYHWLFLGLVLAAGAFIRFWAAPLSAGVDVPQFWAFAKVFEAYGIDFYQYADARLDIFPVKGWSFVYPPVWLLILRLGLLATPDSVAAATWADAGWRMAVKTPIIAADLAIGCLIYWAVTGPKWRKLVFAALWFLHPVAWYNSAVFGQFDAVAAVFLVAAVIFLEKGKELPAFILAGLAVMTKQHTFIPVLMMLAVSARNYGWRRLFSNTAILAEIFLVFSIPFLLTGNFLEYARSLFLPEQAARYQNPLIYAFNGISSLMTHLNNTLGWNTEIVIKMMTPALIIAVIGAAILCYKLKLSPARAALAGFLVFLCFAHRINYQYLVVYIPLALLVVAYTKYRSERIIGIIMALLPAAWLWLSDVSFWFTYIYPASLQAVPIFQRLKMTRLGLADYYYVALAGALTSLFLAYIICTFSHWRKSGNGKFPALKYLFDRRSR